MQQQSVAQATSRVQRGVALYWQHRKSIERVAPNVWTVPSCSGDGEYTVWLDLQACTCPDHSKAKQLDERCKHVVAATIAHAKGKAARKSKR